MEQSSRNFLAILKQKKKKQVLFTSLNRYFKENSSWVSSLPLGTLFQAPHHYNFPVNDREKEDEKQ